MKTLCMIQLTRKILPLLCYTSVRDIASLVAIIDTDHSVPEERRTNDKKARSLEDTVGMFESRNEQSKTIMGCSTTIIL